LRLVTALSSLKSNNDLPRFLRGIFHSLFGLSNDAIPNDLKRSL